MSALTLPALGLAARTAQALPTLFTDLASRTPPAEVVQIDTTGHSVPGKGAARYICDALCDEALLAAHPRFVTRTANNRIFRLLPDRSSLAVEQGGAAGGGTVNDQPAIQAAIDYAHAIEAAEVRFEASSYRLDCPPRLSPAEDKRAEDGHPLVVRRSIALRGHDAQRTVLDFRALDGEDPESEYQLVPTSDSDPALAVWRGGGLYLQGDIANPGPGQRTIGRLEIDRLVFRGNRQHTGAYEWPADAQTGDGWDITDKALWVQDCFVGEIICRDTDMVGWKGEILFTAGEADAVERIELQNCRFATSNGSALNPGVDAEILAIDSSFGDCFQAQEDVAKSRAVYRNCTWHDCDAMGLGSGSTNGVLYAQAYPTRDETGAPPMTLLENCEFRDIRSLRFASWVRGSIRTVDCSISLNGGEALALRDTDLTIESWLDRKTGIHALEFYGVDTLTEPMPGAPVGIYKLPPSHVRIRLSHHRTRHAAEQGNQWLGCFWTGYLDRSCELHISGETAGGGVPNGGATPISMPRIHYAAAEPTSNFWARGWYKLPQITGSGEILPCAPRMTVEMASGIIADMTLARTPIGGADHGYVDGQRIRLVKEGATGAIRFTKGASNSFGVRETRVLDNPYDWIEFSYNRDWQRWEEEAFFSDA
ncbi:hypothetical protein [Qipengyuania gelatinilytica]|uniref:Right-handed parallel beta-helix repeat-containing protein n=1 Tax=Qipengyuania gelatinilytica TaxID=2867231 RepID=A0ABX8ZYD6_9SPHN|nr:hypothetical protein [Qipengyuania gelatinilytica]QZD93909.1 hypothetical protein K3136_07220 [Qipengyuania gelatinilytica]